MNGILKNLLSLARMSRPPNAGQSRHVIGFLVGFLATCQLANGQTKAVPVTLRPYVAQVRLIGHKKAQTGVLFELTDSTILLVPVKNLKPVLHALIGRNGGTLPPTDSLQLVLPLRIFRFTDIRRVTIRRRGQVGKGFLLGAGLGVVVVLIAGGGQPGGYTTPVQNALTGAFLFSIPGLVVGALLTKKVDAPLKSIGNKSLGRFRKRTLVEQLRQSSLYTL
jgi:hypothetical protein